MKKRTPITKEALDGIGEVLPKYYMLKLALLERIKAGELRPDEALPTETELIEQYGVSRITVRRALSELTSERYIYRIQGKGSYVNGKREEAVLCNTPHAENYARLIELSGLVPKRAGLRSELVPCPEADAAVLGLHTGEPALLAERIYYASGTPTILISSYISTQALPGIERYDLTKDSIWHILHSEMGHDILAKSRSIKAISAEARIARHLNVITGYPLLLNRYTSILADTGRVWESAYAYFRTDVLDYLPDF